MIKILKIIFISFLSFAFQKEVSLESRGNCYKDNFLNIFDIILMVEKIHKKKECQKSDINNDSNTDTLDLNLLTDEVLSFRILQDSIFKDLQLDNQIKYKLIDEIDFTKDCFVQGLVYFQKHNQLIVSCGLYGKSSLLRFSMSSKKIIEKINLDSDLFAEGITIFSNYLIQLTWKENYSFYYRFNDFFSLSHKIFHFNKSMKRKEGWGITTDLFEKYIITSDGSANLYFFYSDTLELAHTLVIKGRLVDGAKIRYLNELEYINGKVWSNIWFKNIILMVSPYDGSVNWLDFSNFAKKHSSKAMNGIAYDSLNQHIFITGKKWGKIYIIQPSNF